MFQPHPFSILCNPLQASILKNSFWSRIKTAILADGRLLVLACLGCFFLALSLVLRLVLSAVFIHHTALNLLSLFPVFFFGVINDLVLLSALLAPLGLYLFTMPARWHRLLIGRFLLALALWTGFFALLFLAVAQFYFFQEFNSRFNLVAVDYLIYPHEVFGNIIETYHVVPIMVLVAAYASIMLALIFRKVVLAEIPDRPFSRRLRNIAAYGVALALVHYVFSTHSFDFSDNRIINEITADGISSFFESFHTNKLDYDAFYRTGNPAKLASLLDHQLATDSSRTAPRPDAFTRISGSVPQGLGKMNVVVIVEESFGCEHVDACGQGLDIDQSVSSANNHLTPFIDKLAKQGIFFNRAYATGTRTVRGLEAITASFPPIPSESIIKRPGNDHIATWGKAMRDNGYQTSFLYGGYSQFDNMKPFYSENGFTVIDRLEISNPRFTNIWGVSDQDLFDHARSTFDQQAQNGKPFFAIIMTTSNHSPYTFPVGIDGVRPHGGGRTDGVRYADHALGEFFAKSKKSPWYDNTLFVVVADHGARVYGSERIPLPSYEIPLLIMAPGHLLPRQVAAPISQMDIAPTVMGLLGLPYTAPFFGQNVFAQKDNSRILLFNHNHDVALYQNDKLVVLGLHNLVQTYQYRLGSDQLKEIPQDPGLTDLATAYYQTAFRLFREHAYL
ncbi:MAG: LTA synthase family protein [Desulfobulbus sp.]